MAYELALQSVSQMDRSMAVIGMYNKIRYEILKKIQNIWNTNKHTSGVGLTVGGFEGELDGSVVGSSDGLIVGRYVGITEGESVVGWIFKKSWMVRTY